MGTGPAISSLGLFHAAQQWVLMHTRKLVHLGHLRFSHFPCVDAANALAPGMDVKHDLGRLFAIHAEKLLQHILRAASALPGPGWTRRIQAGQPEGSAEEFLTLVRQQVLARADASGSNRSKSVV